MSPESFCYWLQGFFELSGSESLSPKQIEVIKQHLALVFTKVTPEESSGWSHGELEEALKKRRAELSQHEWVSLCSGGEVKFC